MAQLVDRTLAPNAANEGIAMSLSQQVGAGRGDLYTPNTSRYIVSRDPFRAIRRGRQLFQRKFRGAEGLGPITGDGAGEIDRTLAIGAGHGRQLRGATAVRADRAVSAATWPRVPTAATRRICSVSG